MSPNRYLDYILLDRYEFTLQKINDGINCLNFQAIIAIIMSK